MQPEKITDMSDEELAAEVSAMTEALFKYRFQHTLGQVNAPSKIRAARKQLARLKTAQRQRELAASAAASK